MRLASIFSNDCGTSVSKVRLFTLILNKDNTNLQVGQSYSFSKDTSTNAPPVPLTALTYLQYDKSNNNVGEGWEADAGNVTITAITGNDVSFSLTGVHFVPLVLSTFSPGTGTFTVNASGRITVSRNGN